MRIPSYSWIVVGASANFDGHDDTGMLQAVRRFALSDDSEDLLDNQHHQHRHSHAVKDTAKVAKDKVAMLAEHSIYADFGGKRSYPADCCDTMDNVECVMCVENIPKAMACADNNHLIGCECYNHNCNDHGTPIVDGESCGCECDPGYSGADCHIPPCSEDGDTYVSPPALAGGCQRYTCNAGSWHRACSARHRMEINDMTDAEWNLFARAVNILKEQGTWNQIAEVHEYANTPREWQGEEWKVHTGRTTPHASRIFLPWHRKYFLDVENRLQMAVNDCSVTIPYWNWAFDLGPNFQASPVWSSSRLGEVNMGGQPGDDATKTPGQNIDNLCVKTGSFGTDNPDSAFGRGSNHWARYNDGHGSDCITRSGFAPTIPDLNYATIQSMLMEHQGVNSYINMSLFLEQVLHNRIHVTIGGFHVGWVPPGSASLEELNLTMPEPVEGQPPPMDPRGIVVLGHMTSMYSPYDPVFFFHHGFIDMLWKKWQDTHQAETERQTHDHFMMPHLLFDGNTDHASISSVVMSMDQTDDNPDTTETENACVFYHERRTDNQEHPCHGQWNEIQDCLAVVVAHEQLHDVPRVKTSGSSGDICSPINTIAQSEDRIWLENMERMGMISKTDVSNVLKWQSTINKQIDDTTSVLPESEATECDKHLCFSTVDLLEKCRILTSTTTTTTVDAFR